MAVWAAVKLADQGWLYDGSLSRANLREADLSGADLREADLSIATVAPGQLDQARSLAGATMPDGTEHE